MTGRPEVGRRGGGRRGRPAAAGPAAARPGGGRYRAAASSRGSGSGTPSCASCGRRPGCGAPAGDFVGWAEVIADEAHYVILDFRVALADPPDAAVAGDDAAAVAWVPLGDVAGHDLVPGLAEFLARHGVIPPPGEPGSDLHALEEQGRALLRPTLGEEGDVVGDLPPLVAELVEPGEPGVARDMKTE